MAERGAGYVRLHRSLFGHPAFKNDGEALAFAWLVAKAAWKDTRVRYKERVISLARGQVAVSVRDMANSLDRDRGWVDRFLKRLKIETMIETATVTGVNVITICNYSVYQSSDDNRVTANGTVAVTPPCQDRDTEQRTKEIKKEKKKEELPDWLPLDAWNGWLDMRQTARKPASARAKQMAIGKLEAMHKRGKDVAMALDQSTMRGWTDIYEPKASGDDGQRKLRV